MSYEIGTPAIDMYGTRGFISAVKLPETRGFILSGGMQQVRHEYEVCFDNGRISVLPDGIVAPFVDRAAHLPKVENVEERKAEIKALQDEAQAAARVSAEKARERAAASTAEARAKTPAWAKAVIVAELVKDQSDSQSDYFGSTVRRTVILGFSTHKRDLFPEMRKFAATFEETRDLADAPESAEHREKYSMGAGFYLKAGSRNCDGWKVCKIALYNGADSIPSGAEWSHYESPKPAAAPTPAMIPWEPGPARVAGIRIEEHTHTKKGFKMFIAILPGRVEREEFDRLNTLAKTLGGWYTRPWGTTPGGFAFKLRPNAENFASRDIQEPAKECEIKTNEPARVSPGAAEKLHAIADKMQGEIDSKLASRLTNTPKRQYQADAARLDGYHLQRTQQALRALAALHEAGTVPPVLSRVMTKAAALNLMKSEIDRSNSGYYHAGIDTNKPALQTPEALALWGLIEAPSQAAKDAETLRRKVDALQFAKIPGYFPTPVSLVSEMIEAADIPENEPASILEPEAGSGAILDTVKAARPNARFTAYERHASLRDVLKLKGYDLAGSDFMEATAAPEFDFVLMNPPFENGQDMEHVRHAFRFLKPGGRLVAIMSPGPFFRSDRKAQDFRQWFETMGADKRDIPAGTFKESGTGVSTVMVTISA